ncbi:hypothetical protein TUM22923_14280 [Polynucleobacter sp. TUM22923]|nr:hypothetical protein TUM22923_14280 [Polynucleobacter sp. TUM22923]
MAIATNTTAMMIFFMRVEILIYKVLKKWVRGDVSVKNAKFSAFDSNCITYIKYKNV